MWRWVSFVWGCVVVLASGTLFAFNCYSDLLAARLSLTSTMLNVAVNMGFVGQYLLSFIAGMLSDRLGIRVAYAYGVAAMVLGYGGLYAQTRTVFSTSPVLVALWYLLIGIGGSGYYITTMNNVPKNFLPHARPLFFGVLVTCFGLCGALYTAVYKRYFMAARNLPGMVLVLFVSTAVAGLGALLTQRRLPPSPRDVRTNNVLGCSSSCCCCCGGGGAHRRHGSDLVVVDDAPLLVSEAPAGVLPSNSSSSTEGALTYDHGDDDVPECRPLLSTAGTDTVHDSGFYDPSNDSSRNGTTDRDAEKEAGTRDVTGVALLREPRYVLLVLGAALSIGSAMDYINNTKLILASNHYDESTTLLFVALSSYSNAFGRFFFAVIAYFALLSARPCMRLYCSHTIFLLAGSVFSLLGALLTVVAQGPLCLVAACIQPISYGCIFSVVPDYTQKKWGTKHFGFNFAIITASMSAVSMLTGFVTGILYDHAHGTNSNSSASSSMFSSSSTPHGKLLCYGDKCFHTTFIILFCCALTGFLSFLTLYILEARETRKRLRLLKSSDTSINN